MFLQNQSMRGKIMEACVLNTVTLLQFIVNVVIFAHYIFSLTLLRAVDGQKYESEKNRII